MGFERHPDRDLLPLAEDRLPDAERRRVEAHLRRCRRCAERVAELRRSRRALERGLRPATLPAAEVTRIRAALARRRTATTRRPRPAAFGWRLAASLAAAVLVVVGVVSTSRLQAKPEWTGWRGPLRDGRSLETGLLAAWPEDGPPLAWQADGLGYGFASVAVADGRVFTMGDEDGRGEEDGGQYVVALDPDGGRLLWRTRVGDAEDDELFGPRATPTWADGRLYALTTRGVLVCLDAGDGTLLWRRDLPGEYGGRLMHRPGASDWRWSESPLVDRGRVVVTPGAPDAALVAFDAESGDELWRTVLPPLGERGSDGAGYASAVVAEAAGVRQVVQLLGRGLVGVEAASGRFLWGYNKIANDVAAIPTPVVQGDYVFAATGFDVGAVLLKLTAEDGGVAAREVYSVDLGAQGSVHGGVVLDGGYVYTAGPRGRPLCLELRTGHRVWGPREAHGRDSAAVAYADGRLYFRHENGRVALVEATPAGFEERGSFQLPGPRRASWPHPVIAGGRLYLRDQGRLYAYDVRG